MQWWLEKYRRHKSGAFFLTDHLTKCRQCWKTWKDLRMNIKNTGLVGICGQTLELIDASGTSFQLYHIRGALGALVVPGCRARWPPCPTGRRPGRESLQGGWGLVGAAPAPGWIGPYLEPYSQLVCITQKTFLTITLSVFVTKMSVE